MHLTASDVLSGLPAEWQAKMAENELIPVTSGMSGAYVFRIPSDRPGYTAGDIVLAPTGWRTHAASDGAALRKLDPALAPITTGLGVLGMPGFTAYAGLNLIGKPKQGETVVVAARSARLSGSSLRLPAPGRSASLAVRKMPLCGRGITLRRRGRPSRA